MPVSVCRPKYVKWFLGVTSGNVEFIDTEDENVVENENKNKIENEDENENENEDKKENENEKQNENKTENEAKDCRYEVWKDFEKVDVKDKKGNIIKKAMCKHCKKNLSYKSGHGTSHLH